MVKIIISKKPQVHKYVPTTSRTALNDAFEISLKNNLTDELFFRTPYERKLRFKKVVRGKNESQSANHYGYRTGQRS